MNDLGKMLVVVGIVLVLIGVFDLRSTSDELHARIPWTYLAYIVAGITWYAIRRKQTLVGAA